jgi:hypothetical protein
MRLIAQALALFAIAAAVGLGLTELAVRDPPGFADVAVGPWVSHPPNEAVGSDPYFDAAVATSGALPLARGDGLAFTAATDDEGRSLDGRCVYRIAGPVPSARVWTLAVHTDDGALFANAARRFAFAGSEVMRDSTGAIDVVTSPHARPGNWLPTGPAPFVVKLRLYDTTISDSAAQLDGTLPAIARVSCP